MTRQRLSLELHSELVKKIDILKAEWGVRSRGAALERMLQVLFDADQGEEPSQEYGERSESGSLDSTATTSSQHPEPASSSFHESGALVLVAKGQQGELVLDLDQTGQSDSERKQQHRTTKNQGIDLPGFVRKQSADLRQSLSAHQGVKQEAAEPLPPVSSDCIERCLERARNHWLELYGTPANDAVVEAAMLWLAQDIWRQSDQSDGRLFTWSLACSVLEGFAPGWLQGPPTFEAVMVMAGLLEDPFSASTLDVRIPTLIRRFVHRFRKRNTGMSFQTLEHTMTLHGALKLLQLPTAPGHRLTLGQIRDAYRDMALRTHPDSGGNEEDMRKLNEAYQLLKELYRKK